MNEPKDAKDQKKTSDKPKATAGLADSLGREASRWSKFLRWTIGIGTGVTLLTLFFRDPQSGRIINNLNRIRRAAIKRGEINSRRARATAMRMTQHELEELKQAVIRTIGTYVFMLCLIDVIIAVTIPSVLLKAIFIFLSDTFILLALNLFWARWIPMINVIAMIRGWVGREEVEKALPTIGSLWNMVMSGPSNVFGDGLKWTLQLGKYVNVVAFWIVVGSMALPPVPWFQTPELAFLLLPGCYLFALGTTLWGPKDRGREVSWVMWALVFYIADCIWMASLPGYLYFPVKAGHPLAILGMLLVVTAEAFLAIYITSLSRRPARPVGVGGAYVIQSGQSARVGGRLARMAVTGIIIMITIMLLAFLHYERNWGFVTDNTVMEYATPAINSVPAVKGFAAKHFGYDRLLPEGRVGDGAYTASLPAAVTPLGPNEVRVRFPAQPGIVTLGLRGSLQRGRLTFLWVDSTFTYRGKNGRAIERTGDGLWAPRRKRYLAVTDIEPANLQPHYLTPQVPELALAFRQGNKPWKWVGHSRTISRPPPLGLTFLARGPDEDFVLALNAIQAAEMRKYLEGELELVVRYEPFRRPGSS